MSRRILIVDDDPIANRVISDTLQLMDYNVDSCSNGEEAVNACRKKSYGLIFMDLYMPGMDGLKTSEALRADDKHASAAIIGLSAHDITDEEREGLELHGIDDFYVKPLNAELLHSLVSVYLPRSSVA